MVTFSIGCEFNIKTGELLIVGVGDGSTSIFIDVGVGVVIIGAIWVVFVSKGGFMVLSNMARRFVVVSGVWAPSTDSLFPLEYVLPATYPKRKQKTITNAQVSKPI